MFALALTSHFTSVDLKCYLRFQFTSDFTTGFASQFSNMLVQI